MKKKINKKAISPVITTMLLIAIVIILAIIIFLWARSFIGEAVEKQIAGVKKTADKFCLEVNFKAFVSDNELYIINKGNIPIYEINVKRTSTGTSIIENYTIDLDAGATSDAISFNAAPGEKVTIIPVLLGKAGNQKKKYTCPDSVGVELET